MDISEFRLQNWEKRVEKFKQQKKLKNFWRFQSQIGPRTMLL